MILRNFSYIINCCLDNINITDTAVVLNAVLVIPLRLAIWCKSLANQNSFWWEYIYNELKKEFNCKEASIKHRHKYVHYHMYVYNDHPICDGIKISFYFIHFDWNANYDFDLCVLLMLYNFHDFNFHETVVLSVRRNTETFWRNVKQYILYKL